MTRLFLLGYYPAMALLVFLNTLVEARFGVSRSTKATEALLGIAIIAPLTVPLVINIIVACGALR